MRAVAEKNIEDACSLSINRIKSDKSRRVNRSSLADLFLSFLEKVSLAFIIILFIILLKILNNMFFFFSFVTLM